MSSYAPYVQRIKRSKNYFDTNSKFPLFRMHPLQDVASQGIHSGSWASATSGKGSLFGPTHDAFQLPIIRGCAAVHKTLLCKRMYLLAFARISECTPQAHLVVYHVDYHGATSHMGIHVIKVDKLNHDKNHVVIHVILQRK